MSIETKLDQLGLVLPQPFRSPSGRPYPFAWVRVRGNRAYISGHLPLSADSSLAEPLGKVGAELTAEQGAAAARQVGLAMLGNLQRELGSLNRVRAWLRVLGMVNAAPGFTQVPVVINGFSELILEVFGPEIGLHSRSAVGMAELPFNVPVEIEAEVEIES
jgi:enamine deaminase RidA (YjgF/YER057c/UK114 family)